MINHDNFYFILNFCNAAFFYDYKNIGIIEEVDRIRKCILNGFSERVPHTKILACLSIIDDIILKIVNDDTVKILANIDDLRENIVYMLVGEKTVGDEYRSDGDE